MKTDLQKMIEKNTKKELINLLDFVGLGGILNSQSLKKDVLVNMIVKQIEKNNK